ncbi:sulfurtransferase [Methylobacterium sp. Leaf399]|uniref:rhodanese-like domain-containing protein n=1 Tax=unclassified Methylobacterium TaxID=2615210 RepID=UPI0006F7EA36|nr:MULTISPECIES: rhodanese-like domain-containing protein [unclassified Methylobacterium]KQP55008.1 sulfurtransferase [Methylobacterium sp. Leaf108]KQT09098.1 sulfurtransferase [Methylobacterium sp. Leaf399]KQT78979.1 sulfurtransferase [Methylobacterium sp. Leaf466]
MTIVDLHRDDIKRGLAEGGILLIDVREAHEFEGGHIPGAVPHPLSTLDTTALAALIAEDGRRPVFSCMSGVRSVHALHAAQAAGIPVEAHYRGGFKDWAAAGEPIDS